MTPRIAPYAVCPYRCKRRFRSHDAYRRHRVKGRCLSVPQMAARGVVRMPDGTYGYARVNIPTLPGVQQAAPIGRDAPSTTLSTTTRGGDPLPDGRDAGSGRTAENR